MTLKRRVKDLEMKIGDKNTSEEPHSLKLSNLPKETVISTFKALLECGAIVLKDSEGVAIDYTHLTDEQLYESCSLY